MTDVPQEFNLGNELVSVLGQTGTSPNHTGISCVDTSTHTKFQIEKSVENKKTRTLCFFLPFSLHTQSNYDSCCESIDRCLITCLCMC